MWEKFIQYVEMTQVIDVNLMTNDKEIPLQYRNEVEVNLQTKKNLNTVLDSPFDFSTLGKCFAKNNSNLLPGQYQSFTSMKLLINVM